MQLRLREYLVNTSLVIASLTGFVLLLEGGLRVYADVLFPKMMVLDDTLGWRHAKNVKKDFPNEAGEKIRVVIDEFGNRGSGHPKERSTGKYRILALGDSFTEGVQVAESDVFTAQLEHADPHLEVVNAGVGGYGTVQEYLYLSAEGLQFKPDLVLVMFFQNDLTDNILTYYPGFGPRPYVTVQGTDVEVMTKLDEAAFKRFVLPAPFRMALNKHSYLYYFANSRIYQPMFAQQMRQAQQADLQQIDVVKRYTAFFGVLDKLSQLLRDRSIPLVVAIIPTRDEVASRHSDVAETIIQHCEMESINCFSLLDGLMKGSASSMPLYFREDIHWTREGHKVAANEILNRLHSHAENAAYKMKDASRY